MTRVELDVEAVDVEDMPPVPLPSGTPIEEVLRQHRKRYVMHTSRGDIHLKHLTRTAAVRMDRLRQRMWPEIPYWQDELSVIRPIIEAGGADEEMMARGVELMEKLLPTVDMYAIACITNIRLTSVEDLEALMEALTPVEAEALRQLLAVCTAHAGPCDTGYLEVARAFGVEVITPELMDNMTREQYETLQAIVSAERTQEQKLLKQIMRGSAPEARP